MAALGRSVLAAATNLEDMSPMMPTIESIGHTHVARGITASQYDAIGECLLFSIQEILNDAATPEIMAAWAEAYGHIKSVFIETEQRLNSELGDKAGFTGFKEMTVVHVEDRGEYRDVEVVLDGHGDWAVSLGQFVALDVEIEGGSRTMTSMPIVKGPSNSITFRVARSEERASLTLWGLELGSSIRVSMPCGTASRTVHPV